MEFGKESVEAVHFFSLFHEAVILRDSSKRELIHEIDFVRIIHVFVLKIVSIRLSLWIFDIP